MELLFAAPVIALGAALRMEEAARSYLNADEIHYFFLSLPSSFKELVHSGVHTDHPPLLFFLLHPVASVTTSEFALRLIPLLAGILFPYVVYRWLTRIWNAGAGLVALVLLTLSPNLILLSAQVRAYTIELLFAALALLFLDVALNEGSLLAMILFSASLDLAILSEYSAAFFAGGVGVYFLLRAMQRKIPSRLWAVWVTGQVSALALYAKLYQVSIKPRLANKQMYTKGFLEGAFPGEHQNLFAFSALGTLKQFAYTFSSIALGAGAAVLFGATLFILWKGRSSATRINDRSLATLLTVPFGLACTAAVLNLHPYARSRNTVILCIFVAAGAGIAVESLSRSRRWIAGLCAVAVIVCWTFAADPDQNNIERSRDRRTSMQAAMRYLESSVPRGALVLADQETVRYIRFYVPNPQDLRLQKDFDSQDALPAGPLRVTWRRWDFGEVDDFLKDLASVRGQFGLNRSVPIWVVDGGFDTGIDARLRQRFPGIVLPSWRDFDGAVTIFQLPPSL